MNPTPILNISSQNPKTIGETHGEILRDKIQEIFEIRLERIMTEPQFKTEDQVMKLCRQHLPMLNNFDPDLFAELQGISGASNLLPEAIVLINHYTDIRDIGYPSNSEGECTAIYTPGSNGPLFGQTWDIHGTAKDYVVVLHLKMGDYKCAVFTIAGCLGMTGISNNNLGVCINNLNSFDAKIGVIWPAMVRKMLKQKSALDGKNIVESSAKSSGRYYGVSDPAQFFGMEVSGTKFALVHDNPSIMNFHTNHCLDPKMQKIHRVRQGSTTFDRYNTVDGLKEKHPNNLDELYDLLAKVSIAPTPEKPNATTTCGAMLMDLSNQTFYGQLGHLEPRDYTNLEQHQL